MEDVLDIEVAEKEMEFLDEEEGDEFPVEGMICPVPGCINGKHIFKKYNNYIAHFDRFHKKNIYIYSCPICKVKDAKKTEIVRHFKRNHLSHSPPSLIGKLTENNKFIDPGNFKSPGRGSITKSVHGPSSSGGKVCRHNRYLNYQTTLTQGIKNTQTADSPINEL